MSDSEQAPTRYGQPLYKTNPSLNTSNQLTATRKARIGNDRKGVVIDPDNGEVIGHGGAVIYEFEEVDKERFVKLYLAGLKQAVGMSKAGMEVFQIVYDQIRDNKDKDTVVLSHASTQMAERNFQRGLKELIDRQFIYRSLTPSLYWVNIRYMFNGNRIAFVKAYQIRGTSRQLDLLSPLEGQGDV